LKVRLGSYGTSGQLQQRPSPAEGGIFKLGWWQRFTQPPKFDRVVCSWDTAVRETDGAAYSVGQVWGETTTGYYLLDQWRGRVEFPDLQRAVEAQAAKWNPQVILIEDKSSGSQLLQVLRRSTRLPVIPVPCAKGDKLVRARAISPTVESGRVYLPDTAEWLHDFLQELSMFPNSAYADQVDALSQALGYLVGQQSPYSGCDFS